MLTQAQADKLIATLKEAARKDAFVWEENRRQDEMVVAVEDQKIQFILTLKRNPFEIKLHLRTRDRDIGLVRVDNAPYHCNPDGSEIRGKPHLHMYREDYELDWAEPVDWYDVSRPMDTLERFLDIVRTRFPSGYGTSLI